MSLEKDLSNIRYSEKGGGRHSRSRKQGVGRRVATLLELELKDWQEPDSHLNMQRCG